jgi:hypothetical protein
MPLIPQGQTWRSQAQGRLPKNRERAKQALQAKIAAGHLPAHGLPMPAQREQPSYRGNVTGHSRLTWQNYCTLSPLVLGGQSKGSRFVLARPRFLDKAAKKYCTVKFSPRRERLSLALQIDPVWTLLCASD